MNLGDALYNTCKHYYSFIKNFSNIITKFMNLIIKSKLYNCEMIIRYNLQTKLRSLLAL